MGDGEGKRGPQVDTPGGGKNKGRPNKSGEGGNGGTQILMKKEEKRGEPQFDTQGGVKTQVTQNKCGDGTNGYLVTVTATSSYTPRGFFSSVGGSAVAGGGALGTAGGAG